MFDCPTVPTPTAATVRPALLEWAGRDFPKYEAGLDDLFARHGENTHLGHVAVKASAVNSLYAAGVGDIWTMAKHILDTGPDIDRTLAASAAARAPNPQVVEDIATGHGILTKTGKKRQFYSFATKYCAFHHPNVYPIYDSYVHGVLLDLWNRDQTYRVLAGNGSWRPNSAGGPAGTVSASYRAWHRAVLALRDRYPGLSGFTFRELDHYMWLESRRLGLQVA
jgi:hypothetical protein